MQDFSFLFGAIILANLASAFILFVVYHCFKRIMTIVIVVCLLSISMPFIIQYLWIPLQQTSRDWMPVLINMTNQDNWGYVSQWTNQTITQMWAMGGPAVPS